MSNKKTIFLTGGTGLLGSYLLKLFLQNNYKVYVLARSKKEKTAQHRILEILKFWDKSLTPLKENLITLEGDITLANLGLDNKTLDLIKHDTQEIFHCAAATEFNRPLNEIKKVNVDGTRNVLEFAKLCKSLRKVNHVSTAFVAGNHEGVFREDDLDLSQSFNTTYEQSKFEAEKLVADYRNKHLRIDIYRPPLIVGETLEGKTTNFQQGFYQIFHLLKLNIFNEFPGKNINIHIVPVDELAKSILVLSLCADSKKNSNYHSFSNDLLSFENVLELASNIMCFVKPKLITFNEFKTKQCTPTQITLLKNNILAINPNVLFDVKKTNAILSMNNYFFQKIDSKVLTKLLEYPLSVNFKNA